MTDRLTKALDSFDATDFAKRHHGHKESRSARSYEYLLPCPQCGSERLRWHHEPGGKQTWICWGCSRTGDTLALISLMERIERADAIAVVVDGYVGGDAPVRLEKLAAMPVVRHHDILRLALRPYPEGFELLTPGFAGHDPAFAYLVGERGIPVDVLQAWRVGYVRTGYRAGYAVFPVFMDGGLVYWQARATWDPPAGLSIDHRKAWIKATKYRKTLNPPNEPGFAEGADVLLNYDRAKVEPHVVVVEGPVDAIKVGPHAVALLGKEPTPIKVERLLRMHAQRYTVYLDPGEEERAKALKLASQLREWAPTFIATPPAGYDPGKLTIEQNANVIAAAEPYRPAGLVSKLAVR